MHGGHTAPEDDTRLLWLLIEGRANGHRQVDQPRGGNGRRRLAGAALRWHDETLRSAFAAHNGEEVATTGDGFFVGFDSPDAAVTCAVAIRRRLADHDRRQHGFAPQVRIGLHASEAAQVDGDFRGNAPSTSCRSYSA